MTRWELISTGITVLTGVRWPRSVRLSTDNMSYTPPSSTPEPGSLHLKVPPPPWWDLSTHTRFRSSPTHTRSFDTHTIPFESFFWAKFFSIFFLRQRGSRPLSDFLFPREWTSLWLVMCTARPAWGHCCWREAGMEQRKNQTRWTPQHQQWSYRGTCTPGSY